MRLWHLSILVRILVILPFALADIKIVAPEADAVIKRGRPITVEWEDSHGNYTSFSEAPQYDIFLCAGGNHQNDYDQLAPIILSGLLSDGNYAWGEVGPGVGGSDKRAYFVKMVCRDEEGPIEISYSKRFTLSNMTGEFSSKVKHALASVSGTDGPEFVKEDLLAKRQATATGVYAVPYAQQTGLTRYAPMGIQPPTKITMKTPIPQFPTSAYHVVETFLGPATVRGTMTAPNTFPVPNMENTAAPAPPPNDDMQKFLNRWRD